MVYAVRIAALTALALSATAHDCQGNAVVCQDGTDSILLRCKNSEWETETCGAKQYCMTMAPGMVHCMLQPDDYTPTFSAAPSASTSADAGHSHPAASTTGVSPTSADVDHSHPAASTTGVSPTSADAGHSHPAASTTGVSPTPAGASHSHPTASTTGTAVHTDGGHSAAHTTGKSAASSSAATNTSTSTNGAHTNALKIATIAAGLAIASFAALF
ncbi:hypothetical protein EC988_000276 [Linderina pennispora]|nr:hypothetical protein EC988_000276 [Linderina pennispora]